MPILGLDTCLGAVSVALRHQTSDGAWTVSELYEERQTGHAERLMPMIAAVLSAAGMTATDIRRVAVTLGPGSFTGVRTAVAAARAFRLAAGVEVVGVTSLAVIAHRAIEIAGSSRAGRPLLVAIDARRDRLYAQLFGADALDALSPPSEVTPAEALALAGTHRVLLAGSGAAAVVEAAPDRALDIVATRLEPRAADLVRLAIDLRPLDQILPIYIRQPDAKPQSANSLARTP